jgi:hypothetical protein
MSKWRKRVGKTADTAKGLSSDIRNRTIGVILERMVMMVAKLILVNSTVMTSDWKFDGMS